MEGRRDAPTIKLDTRPLSIWFRRPRPNVWDKEEEAAAAAAAAAVADDDEESMSWGEGMMNASVAALILAAVDWFVATAEAAAVFKVVIALPIAEAAAVALLALLLLVVVAAGFEMPVLDTGCKGLLEVDKL